jgi:hypothetical protein
LNGRFRASHISSIVNPVILIISTVYPILLKNARNFLHLLYKRIVEFENFFKKSEDFFLHILTKCRKFPIIYLDDVESHRTGVTDDAAALASSHPLRRPLPPKAGFLLDKGYGDEDNVLESAD